MKTTFYLALDVGERSMIIRSLNSLRNALHGHIHFYIVQLL